MAKYLKHFSPEQQASMADSLAKDFENHSYRFTDAAGRNVYEEHVQLHWLPTAAYLILQNAQELSSSQSPPR